MLTLFLQVTGGDWLWPMLLQVPAGCGLCAQYHCGEDFLFSSVGAVPGRFEVASLNGMRSLDR